MPLVDPFFASLLIEIRKGRFRNPRSLEFWLESQGYRKNTTHMWHAVDKLLSLRRAGIVEFELAYPPSSYEYYPDEPLFKSPITVTRTWDQIQRVLGISLSELVKLDQPGSLVVQPYYANVPRDPFSVIDVFVLMPFSEEMKPIYQDHIKPVCERVGLLVSRADDFFTTNAVMADIWNAIKQARILVADCTGRNPNVFYEIGLAHVLGKEVVLLTQSSSDIPFDISHLRHIAYQYTPRGMTHMEQQLEKTLRHLSK